MTVRRGGVEVEVFSVDGAAGAVQRHAEDGPDGSRAVLEVESAASIPGDILALVARAALELTGRPPDDNRKHEADLLLARLVETSQDAFLVSIHGLHKLVNRAYLRMFGFESEQEVLGTPLFERIAPEHRAQVRQAMEQRTRGEEVSGIYEMRGIRKDGTSIDVDVRTSVYVSNGQLHTLAILRDMTERRRLEALTRQAQKMEAIGRLAGSVAHDFNNILGVLMALGSTTLEQLTPGTQAHQEVTEMVQCARRAAEISARLLTISRKQVVTPRLLDLHDVLRAFRPSLEQALGERCTLSLELAPAPAWVRADPSQLEQLFLTLVTNARDAMPPGGPVTIATVADDDGAGPSGKWAAVRVTDTGVGMDESTLARLFEPFFTTKQHGTGLGLCTAHAVMEECGGHIRAESVVGRGTTFTMHFPRVVAEDAVASPSASGGTRANVGAVVLLAEDHVCPDSRGHGTLTITRT
ncbi:MAG: ATP-binding protein [Myxococcota bacterium]